MQVWKEHTLTTVCATVVLTEDRQDYSFTEVAPGRQCSILVHLFSTQTVKIDCP